MAFSTENRTISDIFQRSAKYIIPRYQRDYVWNKDNWKELWNDLQFTIKYCNGTIPWSHFLGTIVLNKNELTSNNLESYEVIDGQQRLTTIFVLLIVLYKNFNKIKIDNAEFRAKYVYETFLTSLNNEAKRELIIINDKYENDLKDFIDVAGSDTYAIGDNNNLKDLFDYFDSLLNQKSFDDLDVVLTKLLAINIVEIISGENEEIYNIFEVLNARGQKLRQIDLLKNHIMKYIQPRENDFIDRARVSWEEIINNISALRDPDDFLQHFTRCYIEKKAESKDSVYRLIKEEIDINKLSDFLKDLLEFSKIYKTLFLNPQDNDVLRYFKIKNNKQIRSLISAIYYLNEKSIIQNNVMDKALKQLRNFYFIFNVSRQTSNKKHFLSSV